MALNQLGLGLMFTATDLASGVMGKVRNGFAQTRDEAGRFGVRSKAAFEQFATGAALTTAGLAGLAMFGVASQKATEFGKAVARVRTVIDEAAMSTDAIKEATAGLAASYGITELQQADALYETISAGITDAQKATDLLEVANEFAVGGTTSLMGAVDVLTSAVNTYADTGLSAAQASDEMFIAIAAGKTTAEQLSQSLGEVAPTAHAAGVSFGELQASIAALTVQGIKTPQAVTGLNAMLQNLMKPTSDASAEAKRLGIEFSATALKSKGLQGVLSQLAGNTKVNDETFVKLFGSIDGVKAALALTAGDGAKFNEILDQMKNASGATGKAFEIMANTTSFQQDRMLALKDTSLRLIGEALEPLKASVLKMVNGWLEAFNKMPKGTRDMIVKAAALASAVVAVAGSVLMLVAGAKILAAVLAPAAAGAAGLSLAILPIGLAIVGVVAAVAAFRYAIENNVGGIADRFGGIVEPIKTAWEALVQLFTTGTLDEALTQELLNGDNAAVNFAVKVKQTADNIINFFSGVGTGFETAIKAAEPVFAAFGDALDQLGEAFGGLVGPVDAVDAGFSSAGATGQSVGGTLAKLATIIISVLTVAINIVTGFVKVWDMLSGALSDVGSAFGEVGGAIGEIFASLSEATGGVAGNSSAWQVLGSVLGGAVSIAFRLIASQIDKAAGMLRSFATVVRGVVDVVAGIFTGDWARVWRGAREIVAGMVSGVIDAVLGMVGFLADAADAVGAAFGKDIGAGAALKGFREDAKQFVRGAMGLTHTETTPVPPAVVQSAFSAVPGAGLSGPAPAVAAAGASPSSADWSLASTAAATAAARTAVGALPPTHINASFQVDGETFARLAAKANASGRDGAPTPVDVGGDPTSFYR
jgi:TP901 family phage tail tape measure protein